jgi:hypothetical protein
MVSLADQPRHSMRTSFTFGDIERKLDFPRVECTRLVLALLAAALFSQDADAESDKRSANYLVPECQKFIALSEGDTFISGLNQGRCVGIIHGISYLSEYLPPDVRSCPPKGATAAQTIRVVLAYIERRPQRMHEDFRELAIEALHEAWPCK